MESGANAIRPYDSTTIFWPVAEIGWSNDAELAMIDQQRQAVHTGGCQCGAVRYALYAEPDATICYCRMCQRAVGNYFGAFAGLAASDFAWTKGAPAAFRSSDVIERDFCRDCGTPLSFRYLDKDRISLTIGSLDAPGRLTPTSAWGIESQIIDLHHLADLPAETTEQAVGTERLLKLKSRQA
jgi:hypothetical protein